MFIDIVFIIISLKCNQEWIESSTRTNITLNTHPMPIVYPKPLLLHYNHTPSLNSNHAHILTTALTRSSKKHIQT